MTRITDKITILAFSAILSACGGAGSPSVESTADTQVGELSQSENVTYSVETTPVETLLKIPATKAVLDKYVPALVSHSALKMGSVQKMTLRQIQKYDDEGILTEKSLADVEAALNAL